ncbi:MAG: hypothetical protein NC937_01275 [Candidatus Omnitrophica bacterium]|nr:hypothetical protein [Candidatus Omnitrophota bacterium]
MTKSKKVVLWITGTLIFIWILLPVWLGVWAKYASKKRVNLSFLLTLPGARILNFQWKIAEKPMVIFKTRGEIKVPWKSFLFGANQLLAFQAPATINLPQGKSKINFSGQIQGNFKKGEVNIKDVNIWLEKFGSIFASGRLVKWGKEICEIEGSVKNFAIDELRDILEIQNLPFSALVTGKISITINRDVVKILKFDIDFTDLLLQKQSSPLSGHIKGTYDIIEKKCFLDSGTIITKTDGKVSVKGMISAEDFNLKIMSEGINLEEIISQLPEKWQEKFKVRTEQKISFDGEGFWKKDEGLPFFTGFFSAPGEINYNNFSCSSLKIQGVNQNEIVIETKNVEIGKIRCDSIKASIVRENGKYRCNLNFSFYDGHGTAVFLTSEEFPLKIYGKTEISKINLQKLIHSLNPEILVTGMVNAICFLEFGNKTFSLQAKIDNVPARPFSQKLNIGAVKALASLGSSSFAGSIGKQFGVGNFYYRKLSAIVSIVDGQLTIEGTAKKAEGNDYLVTSEIFGSGINVLVDRNNNSIRIEDLKERIARAMKQNKPQLKLSFLQEPVDGKTNTRSDSWKQVLLS